MGGRQCGSARSVGRTRAAPRSTGGGELRELLTVLTTGQSKAKTVSDGGCDSRGEE